MDRLLWILFFLTVLNTNTFAQETDSLNIDFKTALKAKTEYNPLAPATAAFYSAVLPGLGQAYNKRYWKIPIIYAGIGTSIYFHIENKKDYDRFRNAYKRRLEGFKDDEFYGDGDSPRISDQRLRDAQRTAQRYKDLSIAAAIGFYLLNIIDANVDAHLRQFNISEDLSLSPSIGIDPIQFQSTYLLSLKLKL